MGPLIPQGFVSPELNLFFAFVIGLGFGYVLEQAGFSSSRKLAGVFYGYDFVVLRVFFTAAVTAMTGLLLFNYIGWVDYDMLYVNPTYLWSGIVGGVVMGFGFILGGFCPGTSLVGAVIGKLDAMMFVVGMLIGIFFFGQFYSLFESLYTGSFLGNIYVFDSLGMGRGWFAMMLIAVALIAFFVTQMIEDNVNKAGAEVKASRQSYLLPVTIVLAAGLMFILLPNQPRSKWHEKSAQSLLASVAEGEHLIKVDEVAYSLMKPNTHPLLLIDVRDEADFVDFSLPGAINIPKNKVVQPHYLQFLKDSESPVVFYSNAATDATEAWMLVKREGLANVFVMQGGLNNFFAYFFGDQHQQPDHDLMNQFGHRFRESAREYFREGKAAIRPEQRAVPVIKMVEIDMPPGGGC